MDGRPLIDPLLIERLGTLELRARKAVEGTLAGMHRSRLAGDNVEFAGHKEYTPGDDVSRLDWKAYGRLDRYYLKESLDETNIVANLAVDCSGSMAYPHDGVSKGHFAALLAATMACLLLDQGDAAGLYLFPARRTALPPRASRVYLREISAALELAEMGGRASIRAAASELSGMAGRRGLVAIFSDLLDDDDGALGAILQLARRGHDVCVFHVLDRSEIAFPFGGLSLFCDTESESQVLTEPGVIAKAYREAMDAFISRCRRSCTGAGVDYHLAATDTQPEAVLRAFLEGRQGRK